MPVIPIPLLPNVPHRGDDAINVAYLNRLVSAMQHAIDTLNNREPVKNNLIQNLAEGDTLVYAGQTWKNISGGVSVHGDEDVTLTPISSNLYNYFNTILTADRTVTLSTSSAYDGLTFRVTHLAESDYSIQVGSPGLAYLAEGNWCDATYSSSLGEYYISAFGSLPSLRSVSIPVGSLVITGLQPVINGNITFSPGTGSLVITGYAPTIS